MATTLDARPTRRVPGLEEARALDAEIRGLGRERSKAQARIAERLLRMSRRRLFSRLGYPSVTAYGRAALHYSTRKTRELIGLALRLRDLPVLRAAFLDGELHWTKVRTAASVACPADEERWLELARNLPSRELERLAAAASGRQPLVRRMLELSEEDDSRVEDAVRAVRRERRGAVSEGEAVAAACERAVAGGGDGALGGSRFRVVIMLCPACKKATRETAAGAVAVDPAAAERALCDAEIVDARRGPGRIRRTVPPRIARFIEARDHGRCLAPGCPNRGFVEVHHEGGWRVVGHDPDAMATLCSAHHDARHRGEIEIEGRYPFRFRLADGSPLVTAEPASQAASEPLACSREQVDDPQPPPRLAGETSDRNAAAQDALRAEHCSREQPDTPEVAIQAHPEATDRVPRAGSAEHPDASLALAALRQLGVPGARARDAVRQASAVAILGAEDLLREALRIAVG